MSSKSLRGPKATWLLTGLDLFTRESESSRPFFRATRATVMVAFGPQNLTCGIESAGEERRKRRKPLPGHTYGESPEACTLGALR